MGTSTAHPELGTGAALLARARVAVLIGGTSAEREVSLVSGHAIAEALDTPTDAGDRRGPASVEAIEIRADGRWCVGASVLDVGTALAALGEIDLFFLGLHGTFGEDGRMQGLLETAGFAFTGSGVRASAVAMDKVFSRDLLALRGVPVAPGRVVRPDWRHRRSEVERDLQALGPQGWFVKPRANGSSVGVSRARDLGELESALDRAHGFEADALVEARIDGVELSAGVVRDPAGRLRGLPPIEIQPHAGRFFDYEEKYSDAGAREVCPPENVGPALVQRVRELALCAHEALGLQGYSRTDFIVPRGGGDPVFLEVNTLPGFTPRSLLPQEAEVEGIDYRTLCLWIAGEALQRQRAARA